MLVAKLSTAKTILFGPILDSTGAEYTGAAVGDIKICKNNGTPAALNGSATLTHKEVGLYELALTTSDISAVGVLTVVLSKTTYVAQPVDLQVVAANVYDSLFAAAGTDYLDVENAVDSVADAVLARGVSNVEGSADKHSLGALVMIATNSALSGGTLTAKKPSDDTTFSTYAVTSDAAANPATGIS